MTDVRSLLRQQRDARRIQHPLAAYSDAGKLLCTVCREQIRADSMWDSHIQSSGHKFKLEAARQAAAEAKTAASPTDEDSSTKRKLQESAEVDDLSGRTKRNRAAPAVAESDESMPAAYEPPALRTPPTLIRRPSTTPSQGVEIQMPSRPATPAHRDSASSSASATATAASSRLQSIVPAASSSAEKPKAGTVDEDEWAAFEADIAAASVPYDEDAVISAPTMTAEESAAADAKKDEDGDEIRRRMQVDIDIEDEKEEATRAMEDEFDEMQELETRVQRLKDQRAKLKQRAESHGQESLPRAEGLNGAETVNGTKEEEDDEDDDSEDDDDFDDGFRFRR